jgi:hypothetical protein
METVYACIFFVVLGVSLAIGLKIVDIIDEKKEKKEKKN